MSWFTRILPKISTVKSKGVPEGVWSKCPACLSMLYVSDLEKNQNVCPKCSHHVRIGARKRLSYFMDSGSTELAKHIESTDHLKFKDTKKYRDRLSAAKKSSQEDEALVVMEGKVQGISLVACAFDFGFIGGTMSSAVGDRFVIAAQAAMKANVPLVCFATSGGARMQEGVFSLFQMAKTSAVLAKLSEASLPFISVLCDPTMGGVSASLATLGDVIIAEPKALIGFSGPRVIQQTIREELPEGFQRSEFLLSHGAVDMIVDRRHMRARVSTLLAAFLHLPATEASNDISNDNPSVADE